MNYRGDEDPQATYELPVSHEVRRAAARLAGIRGRAGTPSPKRADEREQAYARQNGGGGLTPAQRRRLAKKQNRAAR